LIDRLQSLNFVAPRTALRELVRIAAQVRNCALSCQSTSEQVPRDGTATYTKRPMIDDLVFYYTSARCASETTWLIGLTAGKQCRTHAAKRKPLVNDVAPSTESAQYVNYACCW